MLTSAPKALVKETSIVRISWNLCQILKTVENVVYNAKLTFLVSLLSAPGALVSMTHTKMHLVFIIQDLTSLLYKVRRRPIIIKG